MWSAVGRREGRWSRSARGRVGVGLAHVEQLEDLGGRPRLRRGAGVVGRGFGAAVIAGFGRAALGRRAAVVSIRDRYCVSMTQAPAPPVAPPVPV